MTSDPTLDPWLPDPLATPEVIAFAGDWHGNAGWACEAVKHAALLGVQTIIHTGDFGYGFRPGWESFIGAVEEALSEHGLMLLGVDGNHENFDWLEDLPLADNGLRWISDHVWHIPRGFHWDWDGVRFLGLGGAVSVDKQWRVPKKSWWWQERITVQDVAKACEGICVDVMVTHDSPARVSVPVGSNKGPGTTWPKAELVASRVNRHLIEAVVEEMNPKLLVHGHHHYRYTEAVNGLTVQGLNCDESTMDENLLIVSLDELKELR